MTANIVLPDRPRILVITLRRLGDVLMTTPLIRTLRQRWPGATLDFLVNAGSDRIVKGNPDIDRVMTIPPRPSVADMLALAPRLWRRYDLAVSTQAGDRPTLLAFLAGRHRVGLVPLRGGGVWWKMHAHHRPVPSGRAVHRFEEMQALADALGLALSPDMVCPQGSPAALFAPGARYAVIHAMPFERYKRWTDIGWRELARGLAQRGLAVVVTEGRDPAERAYVEGVFAAADPPVIRERGQLDWAGLAALLQGAAAYVGPDTSVTHLAAACGCPTIALFGPTSPRRTAPWPVGGLAEMWQEAGTVQRRGNVWVVQNPQPCLPCQNLGCEGHSESYSRCLDELSAATVLRVVDQALTR
jgi:heptosyltransferase III